jgi:hypothetical protein
VSLETTIGKAGRKNKVKFLSSRSSILTRPRCLKAQLLLQPVAVAALGVLLVDEFGKITKHRP